MREKNKIFISHSMKDLNYVRSFVDNVLRLGLDIPSERIFCSSMEGQGIRSGRYIPDSLKEEIHQSNLALLFVSENYRNSEVCLNELGATWVMLNKENIIPMLLPDVKFNELGFLDVGRIGVEVCTREGILKFVQDCKQDLNPNFNVEVLNSKIDTFLDALDNSDDEVDESDLEVDEWKACYTNNLYALDKIIRQTIPTKGDGIHQILDEKTKNQLLENLSKASFLKRFWYKFAKGDYYVEKLSKLPSGNWLMSSLNWELKISQMWISLNSELQYEFILIKSEQQEPYTITSDVGGTDYRVGVLSSGIIVSENENNNGFAIVNGETIALDEHGVKSRYRDEKSHWVFLVSGYHKAGFNYRETFDFCQKLDSGEIDVNEENIMRFLSNLMNHPTVIKYY